MTEKQAANTWDERRRKLVFSTVAKGLSPADQAHFEYVCIDSGLDPLRKEIYAVSRGGRMSIQTGVDGYLKLANSTKELEGMEVIYYDADGDSHEAWLWNKPPAACLVKVYRKNCSRPFTASCRFEAYTQRNNMWQKYPETMLAKATTTLALRRGFADVISGVDSAYEMDQAGMADIELLERELPSGDSTAKPPAAKAKDSKPKAKPYVSQNDAAGDDWKQFKVECAERNVQPYTVEALIKIMATRGGPDAASKLLSAKTAEDIEELNGKYLPAEKKEVVTGNPKDW